MQSLNVQIRNSGYYHTWQMYEIMLDHIKPISFCQYIINRLLNNPDFIKCTPPNNYYYSICHKEINTKLRFDFRKIVKNGEIIGYRSVEINLYPHYHYNDYKHNGNDFSPIECIKAIRELLDLIGVKELEYEDLNVINIEFGLNLILDMCIKDFINGLIYSSKTKFIIPDPKHKYSKATKSKYKRIKGYWKGTQCHEGIQAFEININTFRFEVKSKQAKYIKKLGIRNITHLLIIENYNVLMQELIKEWESVLILNLNPDLKGLRPDDVQFVTEANNTINFWDDLKSNTNPNKFNRYKKKYYKILTGKNNLHHQIKTQIIDKLLQLQSGANFTQPIPINKGKLQIGSTAVTLINLEYTPLKYYIRLAVTPTLTPLHSSTDCIETATGWSNSQEYYPMEIKRVSPHRLSKACSLSLCPAMVLKNRPTIRADCINTALRGC